MLSASTLIRICTDTSSLYFSLWANRADGPLHPNSICPSTLAQSVLLENKFSPTVLKIFSAMLLADNTATVTHSVSVFRRARCLLFSSRFSHRILAASGGCCLCSETTVNGVSATIKPYRWETPPETTHHEGPGIHDYRQSD